MRVKRVLAVGIAAAGIVAGTLAVSTANSFAASCPNKHANVVIEEDPETGYFLGKIGLNRVEETRTHCIWHGVLVEQVNFEIISERPTTHRERRP